MTSQQNTISPALTIADLMASAAAEPAWSALVTAHERAKAEHEESSRRYNEAEDRLYAEVKDRPISEELRRTYVGDTQEKQEASCHVWSEALRAIARYPVTSLGMLVAKTAILAREYSDDFGNGSEARNIVGDIFRLAGLPNPLKPRPDDEDDVPSEPTPPTPDPDLPKDWSSAMSLYYRLKKASDDTPLGTPGEDEKVGAYARVRDHLIEFVPSSGVTSLAAKLRLLAEEADDGVVSGRILNALARDADRLARGMPTADGDHYGAGARWDELMVVINAKRADIAASNEEAEVDRWSDHLTKLEDEALRMPVPSFDALWWKVNQLLDDNAVDEAVRASIRADFMRFGARG